MTAKTKKADLAEALKPLAPPALPDGGGDYTRTLGGDVVSESDNKIKHEEGKK